MSATSTPDSSPIGTPIQPLHNPAQAAHIVVNNNPGMGAKAFLANRMAKSHNPAFISPTDNLMTPCTQKLTAAKKKYFNKASKPVQPFAQPGEGKDSDEEKIEEDDVPSTAQTSSAMEIDEENPF